MKPSRKDLLMALALSLVAAHSIYLHYKLADFMTQTITVVNSIIQALSGGQ
jgi:hypothetical protein